MRKWILLLLPALPAICAGEVHVWQKQEAVFTARETYSNAYRDVDMWIDLSGPGFSKRVYGFWDGGSTFRIRFLATQPGKWTWVSGSNPADAGLAGRKGEFVAVAWTDSEKEQNPCRHGFVRATRNGHALEYSDGTPFFWLGDTWWATPTFRFPWNGDDVERPIGPQAGFQDYVRFRKNQGFNSIAMLAALPQWDEDGKPARIVTPGPERITIRIGWPLPGTDNGKAMHNEGGRAFLFPGRAPGHEDVVPDFERLNPAYFQHLDKKMDYLNAQGFVPFLEVARRDVIPAWKKWYPWPDSYARYVHYLLRRYQANNIILSPMHYDTPAGTIPALEFNPVFNGMLAKWGEPPFGTPLSTNSNPSSLLNWGNGEDARWVSIHQTGNRREHEYYWHHSEIFHTRPAKPSVAGEPYYAGYGYRAGEERPNAALGGSERDDLFCRSAMYGNFLSGAFGGHIYGAEGIWQGAVEPQAPIKIWDAMLWKSGAQIAHFRSFVFSRGTSFQDLIPAADHLTPNSDYRTHGFEGWAFAARSPAKDWFLIYLEKGCPRVSVRSLPRDSRWTLRWFDPRTGSWSRGQTFKINEHYKLQLPEPPSGDDWAASLVLLPGT